MSHMRQTHVASPAQESPLESRIHSESLSNSAQEPPSTIKVAIFAYMSITFLSASESQFALDILAPAAIAHFFVR